MRPPAAKGRELASFLIVPLLTVHLWSMNLASAGPLLGIWLRWAGEQDSLRSRVGRSIAWLSVWALLIGMATGAVQLLAFPSSGVFAALQRMPSRGLWFAGAELLFSLACLLGYAWGWDRLRGHRWLHALLAVATSSNLLYHFPPLMSVLGALATNPNWAKAEELNRAALKPLMVRGEVLALSAHFALASIAVAGVTVLWLLSKEKSGEQEQAAPALARRAAWVSLVATALQLPVGGWLLIAVPQAMRTSIMGSSLVASLAFIGGLLLMFLLLQRLLTIAIGTATPHDLRQACWTLGGLVLLMTATLFASRHEPDRPTVALEQEKTAVAPGKLNLRGPTAAGSEQN